MVLVEVKFVLGSYSCNNKNGEREKCKSIPSD